MAISPLLYGLYSFCWALKRQPSPTTRVHSRRKGERYSERSYEHWTHITPPQRHDDLAIEQVGRTSSLPLLPSSIFSSFSFVMGCTHSDAEDTCYRHQNQHRNTFSSTITDGFTSDASGDLEKLDSRHDDEEIRIHREQQHEHEKHDDSIAGSLSVQTTSTTIHHAPQATSRLPERVASRMSGSSALTFPEGGLAGWLAVFASFCAMLSIFGLINSSAVFESYFSTHQLRDYTSSQIGWIFSLYLFMVFFVGIHIGPIFDRHGPRWLVLCGNLFMVLSLMLLGFCTGESA